MYSILIVDDERFMREGIAKLLPWSAMGIDRVDVAESGTKALEKMKAHMPDIVLTDIEMENMNGLQLIKEMNRMNPLLRIIVLTGHDDFTYVQECCRMEVHDYLLKPVDQNKLIDVIGQQAEALDRLLEERTKKKTIDRVNGLAEQMRVERIFHDFLKKGQRQAEVRQLLSEYGYSSGDTIQVAVIAPEDSVKNEWSSQLELLNLSISSVCIELVEYNNNGITFRDENNALILVLFGGTHHPDLRDLLEKIQTVLQNEYDTAQKVYLGSSVSQLVQLPDSYRAAVQLWQNQQKQYGIIQMEEEFEPPSLRHDQEESYLLQIEAELGDVTKVLKTYTEYWEILNRIPTEKTQIRRSCLHLLTDIYLYWLQETGSSNSQALTDMVLRMNQSKDADLYQVGYDFLKELLGEQVLDSDDVIANAKRYIQQHLAENLSVTQLAGQFYLSVAYFSKLFKRTEGVGCNYYIVHLRMEKAKQLLQRQTKVVEVAEQVGYKDVNYFSLTFKKYTGISPAEFREQA